METENKRNEMVHNTPLSAAVNGVNYTLQADVHFSILEILTHQPEHTERLFYQIQQGKLKCSSYRIIYRIKIIVCIIQKPKKPLK